MDVVLPISSAAGIVLAPPLAMRIVVILIAATLISSCATDDRPVRDSIRAEVEASNFPAHVARDKEGQQLWTKTVSFYRARAFAPVWLRDRRATANLHALTAAIKGSARDGLDPRLYDLAFIDGLSANGRKRFSEGAAGEIDTRLTYTYLRLSSDLANGVSALARSHPAWRMRPQTFDPTAHLTTAISDEEIAKSLDALKPATREYRALAGLLADYRRRADQGQPDTGMDRVALAQRIRQVELNMERWRWIPRENPARHIVVNIPAFRLEVWEGDAVALSMRVVVGKKDTPTPIFIDKLTHVVFSPYWNVPPTIAKDETLPSALGDPSFLQRTNMEILDDKGKVVDPASIDVDRAGDYRFRQRPGKGNALGLVKFMFPNEFNVYLHDTPADSLFARATRLFSHGCVRVEDPQALAEYLLRERPEWTRERIVEAMNAGEERTVKLLEAVPVYIGYWTVDITPDGQPVFLPDVYGLDSRQAALLNEAAAAPAHPARASR